MLVVARVRVGQQMRRATAHAARLADRLAFIFHFVDDAQEVRIDALMFEIDAERPVFLKYARDCRAFIGFCDDEHTLEQLNPSVSNDREVGALAAIRPTE